MWNPLQKLSGWLTRKNCLGCTSFNNLHVLNLKKSAQLETFDGKNELDRENL